MKVFSACHGCRCYFVIAAVLCVLFLTLMYNSYQQIGLITKKPFQIEGTLHKSTNIFNQSSERGPKEVKEIFYKLIKTYKHWKRLPMLGKTFSDSPRTLQVQELVFPKCRRGISMLILLHSRLISLNNRNAIRLSWAETVNYGQHGGTNSTHQVIFLIFINRSTIANETTNIAEESKRFGDILLLNYEGSDETELTTKTIQSLSWIAKACAPTFFLKADDKTFVNVGQLTDRLMKIDSNIMYARGVNGVPVTRHQESYTDNATHGDYPLSYDNPYYGGEWYILGGKILTDLSFGSQKIRPIVDEGAYIEMMADSLGVRQYNETWFTPLFFENLGFHSLDPCDWNKKYLIHHVYNTRHILLYSMTVVSSRLPTLCKE